MTKTRRTHPAENFDDPETIQPYLDDAFATGDAGTIANALGAVARAKSMMSIARSTGLSRESLYRSLSQDGRPELSTVLKVLGALDLRLSTASKSEDAVLKATRRNVLRTAKRRGES